MKTIRLGKVCNTLKLTINPKEYPNEKFLYYSIPAFDEGKRPIHELGRDIQSSKLLISKPCVLFSRLNPRIKRVWGISTLSEKQRAIASTEFVPFVVNNPDELSVDYLFWFLHCDTFVNRARASVQAATKSRERVQKNRLFEIEIPLPPLPGQQRIAAILDKADRLRRLRRFALVLGEGYLQSVFLEMFGDPGKNPYNWELTKIDDIATQVTDGEHVTPKRTSSGIKLLSARNIKNGYIDLEAGLDYISPNEYERISKRIAPKYGDILMSCSGTVGRVTTVNINEPISMVRSVAIIKPKHSLVKSKYLEHYLRSDYCQELIYRSSNISGQPNIFQRQIRELPVTIPPISFQEKFVQVVRLHERLRSKQKEALRQADHLFQSLLQHAFRGYL
jgi:type I restriction enzyme S subunit